MSRTADRLRAAGERVTPQRLLVADVLDALGGQVTAQELWHSVRRRQPHIGRATVFRTLDALVVAGVARRLERERHASGYVACEPRHHHHLACASCGSVQEVDEALIGPVAQSVAAATGFLIDDAQLDFYGRCARCAQRGPASGSS